MGIPSIYTDSSNTSPGVAWYMWLSSASMLNAKADAWPSRIAMLREKDGTLCYN